MSLLPSAVRLGPYRLEMRPSGVGQTITFDLKNESQWTRSSSKPGQTAENLGPTADARTNAADAWVMSAADAARNSCRPKGNVSSRRASDFISQSRQRKPPTHGQRRLSNFIFRPRRCKTKPETKKIRHFPLYLFFFFFVFSVFFFFVSFHCGGKEKKSFFFFF